MPNLSTAATILLSNAIIKYPTAGTQNAIRFKGGCMYRLHAWQQPLQLPKGVRTTQRHNYR